MAPSPALAVDDRSTTVTSLCRYYQILPGQGPPLSARQRSDRRIEVGFASRTRTSLKLETSSTMAQPATSKTTAASQSRRAYLTFLAGDGDYVKVVVGLAKGLRKGTDVCWWLRDV
ncbi:hypothetical protein HYC85_013802 [Camellia sinensis]|uniref:Uncharacterized protein n=1 Tax=Camellia sinensis TaxID=4442 RepID=A0A7J7H5P5_CAMSI|nr:hypothetical protein HYC85_013802 [Camellia sinensis]